MLSNDATDLEGSYSDLHDNHLLKGMGLKEEEINAVRTKCTTV